MYFLWQPCYGIQKNKTATAITFMFELVSPKYLSVLNQVNMKNYAEIFNLLAHKEEAEFILCVKRQPNV